MTHVLKKLSIALVPVALLAAGAISLAAQTPRPERIMPVRPGVQFEVRKGARSLLGVTLSSSPSMRDTLGVMITAVTSGSPAARAGLQEGDRIAAVNGVNLRVSRSDAGEPDMAGIMARRIQRVLDTTSVGSELELNVYSEGSFRTVKVVPEENPTRSVDLVWHAREARPDPDRATLGASLGGQASPRDTLGIFVSAVAEDGPLAQAGIYEGARIAAINGVDLRVNAADLGDPAIVAIMSRRLTRELEKLSPGDRAQLRVWVNGQYRDVPVTLVRHSELKSPAFRQFFGPGGAPDFPEAILRALPRMDIDRGGAGSHLRGEPGRTITVLGAS